MFFLLSPSSRLDCCGDELAAMDFFFWYRMEVLGLQWSMWLCVYMCNEQKEKKKENRDQKAKTFSVSSVELVNLVSVLRGGLEFHRFFFGGGGWLSDSLSEFLW